MKRINFGENIPFEIQGPFQFREKDGLIEGSVNEPWELIVKFEPVDILNGVTELIDQSGKVITIHSDNETDIIENEYSDKTKLYLLISLVK